MNLTTNDAFRTLTGVILDLPLVKKKKKKKERTARTLTITTVHCMTQQNTVSFHFKVKEFRKSFEPH